MSKADDLFYARLKARQAKTKARVERRNARRPQRVELIAKVRDGEITLKEAQARLENKP